MGFARNHHLQMAVDQPSILENPGCSASTRVAVTNQLDVSTTRGVFSAAFGQRKEMFRVM